MRIKFLVFLKIFGLNYTNGSSSNCIGQMFALLSFLLHFYLTGYFRSPLLDFHQPFWRMEKMVENFHSPPKVPWPNIIYSSHQHSLFSPVISEFTTSGFVQFSIFHQWWSCLEWFDPLACENILSLYPTSLTNPLAGHLSWNIHVWLVIKFCVLLYLLIAFLQIQDIVETLPTCKWVNLH